MQAMEKMRIILTGATGYVGEGVLLACLDNPAVEKVLSVSRRPCGHTHPKLEEYLVPDFMDLKAGDPKLQDYDAVFFCAGISSVGVKEAFYKIISHDIPLHFADAVGPKENMTFIYLSGAGTGESNPQKWAKVKTATEKALMHMPFKHAFGFRPAFMKPYAGQRFITGIQKSFRYFYPVMKFFGQANTIQDVENAMVRVSQEGYPSPYISVKDIRMLAPKNRSLAI